MLLCFSELCPSLLDRRQILQTLENARMFGTKKFLEESRGTVGQRFCSLVVALETVGTRQTLQAKRDALILASEFHCLLAALENERAASAIALLLQRLQARVVLGSPAIFSRSRPSQQEKHPAELLDGTDLAGLQSCECASSSCRRSPGRIVTK